VDRERQEIVAVAPKRERRQVLLVVPDRVAQAGDFQVHRSGTPGERRAEAGDAGPQRRASRYFFHGCWRSDYRYK